jgi:hypothetical protein
MDEADQVTTDNIEMPGSPVPVSNGQGPFSSPSIVDLLQQDMQELAAAEVVYIPVKGYENSRIQIRYRMPESGKELDMITRKVQREIPNDNFTQNLTVAIDTMIHLCIGIYAQPDGVDEPQPFDPDNRGMACTFDESLAKVMGLEPIPGHPLTSRMIVRKLFGNSDMMILGHAERLQRWLMNVKANVNAELWESGE